MSMALDMDNQPDTIESAVLRYLACDDCGLSRCEGDCTEACEYCRGTLGKHERGCDAADRCDCGEDSSGRVVLCRECAGGAQ